MACPHHPCRKASRSTFYHFGSLFQLEQVCDCALLGSPHRPVVPQPQSPRKMRASARADSSHPAVPTTPAVQMTTAVSVPRLHLHIHRHHFPTLAMDRSWKSHAIAARGFAGL